MKINHQQFAALHAQALHGEQKQKAYTSLYNLIYSTVHFAVSKQCLNLRGLEKESYVQLVLAHILNPITLAKYDAAMCPGAWIYSISRNKCIEEYHKNARYNGYLGLNTCYTTEGENTGCAFEPADLAELPDEMLQKELNKEWLYRTIDKVLDGDQKKVLQLYYLQEKSQQEIMAKLGLSKSNVGVLLNRALNTLKGKLLRNVANHS